MKHYVPITLSLMAVIICPFFGFSDLDLGQIFEPNNQNSFIFWNLRVPRIILCWLCGAGLAIGGMSFQALFKN